jgi:hypothetical protein
MTSHYTRGSVTTLHDLGGVLGRPLDTLFWALKISWSQLSARVWSGPENLHRKFWVSWSAHGFSHPVGNCESKQWPFSSSRIGVYMQKWQLFKVKIDLQFFGATRKLGVINEQSPISLGKVQVCGPNFRPLDRPMGCPIRLAIVNHNEYSRGVHYDNIRKQRAGKYRVIYIHKRKNLEFS